MDLLDLLNLKDATNWSPDLPMQLVIALIDCRPGFRGWIQPLKPNHLDTSSRGVLLQLPPTIKHPWYFWTENSNARCAEEVFRDTSEKLSQKYNQHTRNNHRTVALINLDTLYSSKVSRKFSGHQSFFPSEMGPPFISPEHQIQYPMHATTNPSFSKSSG